MPSRRKLIKALLLSLPFDMVAGSIACASPSADFVDWEEVRRAANEEVREPELQDYLPFFIKTPELMLKSDKKVFAHYLTSFPLSIDNLPEKEDYYNKEFLERSGEHGKYQSVGGYLRDRPLGIGPHKSKFWKQINLAIEVLRARELGIDGFGVDLLQIGSGPLWEATLMLCDVVTAVAPDFHLIFEPDAVALARSAPEDVADAILILGRHPAAYRIPDGRVVIAPFAPERLGVDYWSTVLDCVRQRGILAAFMPIMLNRTLGSFAPLSWGFSEWGPRDINEVLDPEYWKEVKNFATPSLKRMASVAPQDERPRESIFWEPKNTALYRGLWEHAIYDDLQYIQIITWNDYAESTHISPSKGIQFLFCDLTRYFISWFKTGSLPKIRCDALFYCHRRNIFDLAKVAMPGDVPMHLVGRTPVENTIEVLVFLTKPSTLEICIADQKHIFVTKAGTTVCYVPAEPGVPTFRIYRHGKMICSTRSHWEILSASPMQDLLYVGGSSLRNLY